MFYQFSVDELLYCIRIGNRRQQVNTKNGVRSKQFTERDPTNIHIQGVMGELAFMKICEKEMKLDLKIEETLNNTSSRGAARDSFDCMLFGKTVDVKSTLNRGSKYIYARQHKSTNPADFYVLILIEFMNPNSTEPIYISQNYYDQFFGAIQADIHSFQVRCQFYGFIGKDELFETSKDDFMQMTDGSVRAKVNSRWSDFSNQFSLPSQSSSTPPTPSSIQFSSSSSSPSTSSFQSSTTLLSSLKQFENNNLHV